METSVKLMKQLEEARYLTTENAWRYRTILRFFYLQYEKMKYWIYKEEVFEELVRHNEFDGYTIELLKQDLDSLVSWRNLIPVQDTSRVSTVEEFKNKQFRYKLTEYTVEIERMAIKLENLSVESASLEPSLLEKIREEIKQFPSMAYSDPKQAGPWWRELNDNFRRLNQNYQDYIGDFYSLKADEMMKTHEFIVYKEKFINYLRDFIKGLQYNSSSIEEVIRSISHEDEKAVLSVVLSYEMSIPRIDMDVTEGQIRDNINGKWESIRSWFLGADGRESESSRLLDMTNEIIRRITRFAAQISESRNSAANRKEEYKKLAELFLSSDINDAHKLSALSFGIFSPRHIKSDMVRKTDSINSGIFDEEPYIYTIKPRVRTYREKTAKSPIISNKERKAAMLERIMNERQEEKTVLESYIQNGCIDFASLPVIEPKVRFSLLRWLTKGINSKGSAKTEHGRVFKVYPAPPDKPQGTCTLKCTDGELQMPCYKLVFMEDGEI